MKKTKLIALSSTLSALCVVFMLCGALINVLDMTAAIAASCVIIVASSELPTRYCLSIYVSASLLALMLLPEKSPVVYFALFSGFYPIIAPKLARLSKPLALLIKFAVFNVSATAVYLVLLFVIGGVSAFTPYMLLLLIPLNVIFIMYDFAVSRISLLWRYRLRKSFERFFK
jgi:hypothetical protein